MLHAPQRACTTAGVHPIKHAFAEWHIAPVTRKTPIFRPMSRTFKLPGGGSDAMVPSLWKTSTRCFHAPLFVKIVPELSYESKLLQTRYRRNRMFVLRGLREKWERERKRRRRKRIHTHRSRITILGVLLDRSIDIGSSFHREASREKKKFFSPYLMIYFSSHFTNDKRLWNGGERS